MVIVECRSHDALLSLAVLSPVEVLGHRHPAQGVARVVKVPGFPRLVDEPAPVVLAAEEQVLLQRGTVEEPSVGRHRGRVTS